VWLRRQTLAASRSRTVEIPGKLAPLSFVSDVRLAIAADSAACQGSTQNTLHHNA
jgi:hypothetical protein